jgi:hypothetical protein
LTFDPETEKYALDPNDKVAMDEALAAAACDCADNE